VRPWLYAAAVAAVLAAGAWLYLTGRSDGREACQAAVRAAQAAQEAAIQNAARISREAAAAIRRAESDRAAALQESLDALDDNDRSLCLSDGARGVLNAIGSE